MLKGLYNKTLKKMRLAYLLTWHKNSYLVQTGYIQSMMQRKLQSPDGSYIPWMNYPIIDFLKERLKSDLSVFEYGSGASTVFFGKRVKTIISVEYDQKWYEKIKKTLHKENILNAKLYFQELNEDYPLSVEKYGEAQYFDIIIIDGRKRVESAKAAFRFLAERGIVIFDDSGREEYKPGINFYTEKGFKKLSFRGLKPTTFGVGESTILYRSDNCLGL